MSPIVDPAVEAYVEAHSSPPPAHLAALAAETRASLRAPQMLTGAVEGRFLELLVWCSGARQVLEIGTYSGYSALAMAAGLPAGGRIVTCEIDAEHADFARRHIAQSPHAEAIEVRLGPALATIESLPGPFDLVFIDADKESYPDYYEATLPKLAERGLLVIDNTLRGGGVLAADDTDERTRGMAAFNERVLSDPRVTSVLLSVRDGVTLVRRAG